MGIFHGCLEHIHMQQFLHLTFFFQLEYTYIIIQKKFYTCDIMLKNDYTLDKIGWREVFYLKGIANISP